jgi:lipopolysaccharide/colanic/teichoic acid biosynthesis glycosyltransferase
MTDSTFGIGAIRYARRTELNLQHKREETGNFKVIGRGVGSRHLVWRYSFLLSFLYSLMALALLIAIAPLMAAIALAIYAQDGGPAFFAHTRVGLGGRRFRCLKFRTMCVDAETRLTQHLAANATARQEWQANHKLRDDPRVTPLGAFLRRSSLDELPQLINVLRGEMSLVGPRPIVEAEIAKYSRRFCRYASVKPGLTGLWQVSGRNDTSYRTRVALDCLYAARRSFAFDVLILLRTVPAVLARQGSY